MTNWVLGRRGFKRRTHSMPFMPGRLMSNSTSKGFSSVSRAAVAPGHTLYFPGIFLRGQLKDLVTVLDDYVETGRVIRQGNGDAIRAGMFDDVVQRLLERQKNIVAQLGGDRPVW